ncbi:hypothetical protein [Streptomyces virginiae]|uniref:hypothetical protein n=1 Tax=Streptomyces virginiae TaxID=1961 RepID=UPI00386F67FB|nr:hypothetical protein OG253_41225 [Streptomyces virginiae]WTB28157.1 hypothetical protein OG253_41280 [Streptomyces virginiae]
MTSNSAPRSGGRTEVQWTAVDPFAPDKARVLAQQIEFSPAARRAYVVAYIVSDETAEQQMRQLLERILQTGRIARSPSGWRARSHKADSPDDGSPEGSYAFILDGACRRVVAYLGPAVSWFDQETHIPTEDLLHQLDQRRRKETEAQRLKARRQEEQAQRQAAHEERMRVERAAAEARRAAALPVPTWPLFDADQAYDWDGRAVPLPHPRHPVTDEETIRRAGRRPDVLFHADALNSPFFRDVPLAERPQALRAVVDSLLRAPTKGRVTIGPTCITVTGLKVTFTLTPDCAMVRTLNPPKPGNNEPARYRADRWKLPRPKKSE